MKSFFKILLYVSLLSVVLFMLLVVYYMIVDDNIYEEDGKAIEVVVQGEMNPNLVAFRGKFLPLDAIESVKNLCIIKEDAPLYVLEKTGQKKVILYLAPEQYNAEDIAIFVDEMVFVTGYFKGGKEQNNRDLATMRMADIFIDSMHSCDIFQVESLSFQ